MKITDITVQKRNKERLSVSLDGVFAFGIDAVDAHQLGLKIGGELTEDELSYILDTVEYTKTQQRALNLISSRAYTEKGLSDKLKEKGCHPDNIAKAIVFLKEYGYLDDADYARRFIIECLELRGYGVQRIRQELYRRGVPREITDSCLAEADLEESQQRTILPLLERKLAGCYDRKSLERGKRFLYGKGYSFDMINWAVRQVLEAHHEEESEDWEI